MAHKLIAAVAAAKRGKKVATPSGACQQLVTIEILSFAKYLYWSELSKMNFERALKKKKDSLTFGFYYDLSHYYSSLYVVIEGWKGMKIKDDNINYLLNKFQDNVDKLRKFRNTIYHFQPDMFDKRFEAGIHDIDLIPWILCLECEFKNFLWNFPLYITSNQKQIDEIRFLIFKTLNWNPYKILPAKIDKLKKCIQKNLHVLQSANDYSSPEAEFLLKAMHDAVVTTKNLPMNPLLSKYKKESE